MDAFLKAYIQQHVHVDAAQRVFCKNVELKVHKIGGVDKIALPPEVSKQTFSFDDLKRAGARVDVVSIKSMAIKGGEARWADNIESRRGNGLPSNVYIANARSIDYCIEKGKMPPKARYIGRKGKKMTIVYDTVQEVVDAMANDDWKTEFKRGSKKS